MPNDVRQYPNIKVLYIEDEPFTREKLLRVLNRRFRNVLVASDGEEGYQLYTKYRPDLIITDLKMNKMNGLEMMKKIREHSDKVQIIVTTAHDDNDFFIQSIENNVNHFILKPIDLDRLLLAIQKSVFHIQIEQELTKQKGLTKAILDFQDNLIFVIEKGMIVEFNEAFASFTGISKNEPLPKNFAFHRFFSEDPNYFYPKVRENWFEEFFTLEKKYAKVRLTGTGGKDGIYYIKATSLPNENQFLFVCTDITELETESKKNELLSTMDPLTTIFNRQKFDDLLTCEMRRAERYNYPFSIIMFDIDNFRNVNEQFCYQQGDEVLITLSTMVQQRIRECDIFARWGGEEFILLTPDTDIFGANELSESIRSLIEGFYFQVVGHLTCSFGVAEFSIAKSKKELLKEADHALLQSKNKGKNCVTMYSKEIK